MYLETEEQRKRKERRDRMDDARKNRLRYTIDRDEMPKWELWKKLYHAIGAYNDYDLEVEYKETLSLMDAQVSCPDPDDTPESRANEIEGCIEFSRLLEYAQDKEKQLSGRLDNLRKDIVSLAKAVTEHS